jgi:Crinkler effector protein N-terminal domain
MFVTSSAPIQDSSRQLNCLINRESIVFVVTVGCDCVISGLKEEIQRKRAMGILKDVDPHTLELWKVNAIDGVM